MAHDPYLTIRPRGADEELRIPRLGLGTWELEGDTAYAAVRAALALGYRHVDTAQLYGNEEAVGRAINDAGVPRDQVWVTTKVWFEHADAEGVERTTKESLERLGLDHVDLLLVHWPAPDVASIAETVEALHAQQEAGRTRAIGVSNYTAAQVEEAAKAGPVVTNQVEMHVNLSQEAVRGQLARHDMFLTAYSPLVHGGERRDPDGVVGAIAGQLDATPQQVMLAYLLAHEDVVALPRSSDRDHLASNLAALELELSEEQVTALRELPKDHRVVDPPFAPNWDDA